jgi:hypothetical protein
MFPQKSLFLTIGIDHQTRIGCIMSPSTDYNKMKRKYFVCEFLAEELTFAEGDQVCVLLVFATSQANADLPSATVYMCEKPSFPGLYKVEEEIDPNYFFEKKN